MRPEPVVSVAIMHHPAREARIADLLGECAGLDVRVVLDPDPSGPPSALRTAKRAWAAVPRTASHHLVLQDDVRPVPGFAAHLREVIGHDPDAAVALYVNWDSPRNSYRARLAAVAGVPFTTLSDVEWTPTLGLVLPADRARELASYLSAWPDEHRADDELVTRFRRERGLRAVVTVPHLVQHDDGGSVAGNQAHGRRRAAVHLPDPRLLAGHWNAGGTPAAMPPEPAYVLELFDSRCAARLSRPAVDGPVDHPFGWHWYDWSPVAGLDPDRILEDLGRAATADAGHGAGPWPRLRRLPVDLLTEVWAAGHLLGSDGAEVTRVIGDTGSPAHAHLTRSAIATWIDSGLSARDQASVDAAARDALVEMGLRAVAAGGRNDRAAAPRAAGEEPRTTAALVRLGVPDGVVAATERMARREAAGHLLADCHLPALRLDVVACPWCDQSGDDDRMPPVPFRRLIASGLDPAAPRVGLTMLACETLTARSLLVLAAAVRRAGVPPAGGVRTRAATVAAVAGLRSAGQVADMIRLVDAGETWADPAGEGPGPAGRAYHDPAGLTLPASSRPRARRTAAGMPGADGAWPELAGHRALLGAGHFLTPHAGSSVTAALNTHYGAVRVRHLREAAGPRTHT